MLSNPNTKQVGVIRLGFYLAAGVTVFVVMWLLPALHEGHGQETSSKLELAGPSAQPAASGGVPAAVPATRPKDKSINIFALAVAGGIFMIPIAGMSVLAVTMTIDRLLALRTQRVLPEGLVGGLGQLATESDGFDPRKAYRVCQQFPSAAASVVRVMLLKVGRPLSEVETAVAQASQREADRLYSNVRWLNLAASLSTLLGLIGTIQGMIMAFHRLTVLDAAADRTTALADGIYTALVTTFAGLFVAIPTLLASHFFENRILSVFRQIDELVFNLLPQLERYEGRVRFSRHGENGDGEAPESAGSGQIEAETT